MRIMNMIGRTAIAGLLWAVPALGQPAQDQNHDAHHPDTGPTAQQQSSPPPSPQAGRMGPGMMGGNMMGANPGNMMGGNFMGQGPMGPGGMLSMMNMMMGAQPGSEHAEGRIAFIKAELKITEAQMPQWNAFAEAVRGNVGSMAEMRKSMMAGQGGVSTLPVRLALEDKLVTAHLAALKKTEEALGQLYRMLTDDQKKVADTIVLGPMGIPMGMM
jgi:hypothetical protein